MSDTRFYTRDDWEIAEETEMRMAAKRNRCDLIFVLLYALLATCGTYGIIVSGELAFFHH